MRSLTKVQQKVLETFTQCWLERGGQPNLSEVARRVNIHYMSLKQHLDVLCKKGYLLLESQGRGKTPIVRLAGQGVPLVGFIAAGGLVSVEERLEGFFDLPGEPGRFAARVVGDSMAEKIEHDDVVIFKKQQKAKFGDVCAVRFESESTLKYFKPGPNGVVRLEPHNPSYDPIIVKPEEVYVEGVYRSLLRGDIIKELFIEFN
jgi:repressor LexA